MKKLLTCFLFFASLLVYAQDNIIAEEEKIYSFKIGDNVEQASYQSTDEGFYSIGSPFTDSNGNLFFYKAINGIRCFLKIANGTITSSPYKGNLSDYREQRSRNYNSQSGIIFDLEPLAFNGSFFYEYNFREKIGSLEGGYYHTYPTPFGSLLYSEKQKQGIAIVFDVSKPSERFSVIPQDQLRAWLPTQPGGFTIGNDGLLYRNGVVWSAIQPTDSTGGTRFVGRLMSGHLVWMGQSDLQERYLIVSNSQGKTEVKMEIPWGSNGEPPLYFYNSGLGPWGELYCLLPPTFVITGYSKSAEGEKYPVYEPDPKGSAELVVVRNHLKYFGRLNDGGVRLRKEPATSGEILGTYPSKTGFRILEKGTKEETIAGQKNVWYKVRLLDGTEGWFFGAFVHNLYDGPNGNPPPWPNVPDW